MTTLIQVEWDDIIDLLNYQTNMKLLTSLFTVITDWKLQR